jgi:hypothetical protein
VAGKNVSHEGSKATTCLPQAGFTQRIRRLNQYRYKKLLFIEENAIYCAPGGNLSYTRELQ